MEANCISLAIIDFTNYKPSADYTAFRISAVDPSGTDGGELHFFGNNGTSLTTDPAFVIEQDGNILIGGDLQHYGDDNTQIQFSSDVVEIEAGGNVMFLADENGVQDILYLGDTANTTDNDIYLSRTAYIDDSTNRMGLGLTNPSYQLQLSTDSAAKPTSGTWTITSDSRVKRNVQNFADGMNIIRNIRPVSYELNGLAGMPEGDTSIGIIAQEIKDIAPYTVGTFRAKLNPTDATETELYNFDASALTFVLINATKDLDTRVTALNGNYNSQNSSQQSQKTQITTIQNQLNNQQNSITNINNKVAAFTFNNSGEIILQGSGENFTVRQVSNNSALTAVSAFAKSVIANLQVGFASIQTLTAGRITTQELNSPYISSEFIQTENVVATNITSENINVVSISAKSARALTLEAEIAKFEKLTAQTADITNATISGTLYANNIDGFDDLVASAVSDPSLLDMILGNVPTTTASVSLDQVYAAINQAGFSASPSSSFAQEIANLNLEINGDTMMSKQAAYIENYFEVNGDAQFNSNVAITNSLVVGDTIVVADGLTFGTGTISYQPANNQSPLLKIQPQGRGSLSLFAGLMTLDESGTVFITGDLTLAGNARIEGTLFTDLLKPTDFGNPFQVQVAGAATNSGEIKKSRFEIVDELGSPVATISAEGNANFAGDLSAKTIKAESVEAGNISGSNQSAVSGRSTLPTGQTEITINSDKITSDSIISITPQGSTQNQVVYVKSQTAHNTNTQGSVVVGVDSSVNADIQFNWWIVK